MKKIFVLFLLFTLPAIADDYITQYVVGGCDINMLENVNGNTYFIPVFTINTYTCSAGTFLPANTLGCRPCPNGFTCAGGTFSFNETEAQGIVAPETINQNANNTCASNILKSEDNNSYFVPIFTPNTININWDNGDTTTTTTCEYNGTITLPPEPSPRPGYTFSGWRLKEN